MKGDAVLVVDDERAVRNALRRAFTLAGYEVEQAEDGRSALGMLLDSSPDAVVLDVLMPESTAWRYAGACARRGSHPGADADRARDRRRPCRRP